MKRNLKASKLTVQAPLDPVSMGLFENVFAVGASIQIIPLPRQTLTISLRSIAVTELKTRLSPGDTTIQLKAPIPDLPEARNEYEDEVVILGELALTSCGRNLVLPYIGWDSQELTIQLAQPFSFGENEEEDDMQPLEPSTIIKLREVQAGGRVMQRRIDGYLHLHRNAKGLLRAYVMQDEDPVNGIWPFWNRKMVLRRSSAPLIDTIFEQLVPSVQEELPFSAAEIEASSRVKGHAQHQVHNDAAFLDAASLRMKIQSLVDGGIRLVDETDVLFPHIKPDVEVLISGLSNRFIALPMENNFICTTVSVRVARGDYRESFRFSSLTDERWRNDGHFSDRYLIIVLYHILKAVEQLNEAMSDHWKEQLSLQVYTYDSDYAKDIRQMLLEVLCRHGGLDGPRPILNGGSHIEPVSWWQMSQYLCLVLTPHTNGILSNELLKMPGVRQDEAVEEKKATKKEKFARTSPMICIMTTLTKFLAFSTQADNQYGLSSVLYALSSSISPAAPEKSSFSSFDDREGLLEYRILKCDWERRQNEGIKQMDSIFKIHEAQVWIAVRRMRRILSFLQDGVARNYAVKLPSSRLMLMNPTLARLAFIAHHEIDVSLEGKKIDRRKHPKKQTSIEAASRLQLVCRYRERQKNFAELNQSEQSDILEKHFSSQSRKMEALLKHLFGAQIRREVPKDAQMEVDYILNHYQHGREKDIETFEWTYGSLKKSYSDLVGLDKPRYVFKVLSGMGAPSLWDNEYLVVESSSEGRRCITTFQDDVTAYKQYIPSSFLDGTVRLAGRRLAKCKLRMLPR